MSERTVLVRNFEEYRQKYLKKNTDTKAGKGARIVLLGGIFLIIYYAYTVKFAPPVVKSYCAPGQVQMRVDENLLRLIQLIEKGFIQGNQKILQFWLPCELNVLQAQTQQGVTVQGPSHAQSLFVMLSKEKWKSPETAPLSSDYIWASASSKAQIHFRKLANQGWTISQVSFSTEDQFRKILQNKGE
jgi:hypothetical protein